MKETKVYVDDELLINDDLSLCCTKDFDNKFYTNNYSLVDNEEYFEATFKDIKAHDRELVKEVCEKIKLKFSDIRTHNWGIEQFELYEFLDQIQKEFEDE